MTLFKTDLFYKGSEEHMNMRAVFLHVLGDALGSVIVMISATVLWLVPVSGYLITTFL